MVLIQILWSCWGFIFLWGDPHEEHEVKVPPDLHGDSLVVQALVAKNCNRAFTWDAYGAGGTKTLKSLPKGGAAKMAGSLFGKSVPLIRVRQTGSNPSRPTTHT